jgi:hypothetical protein
MITRVEIDGFKSFLDFQLVVPPFLAPAGPHSSRPDSSGRFSLFDALEFTRVAPLSAIRSPIPPATRFSARRAVVSRWSALRNILYCDDLK